jgi:hypothetical protein
MKTVKIIKKLLGMCEHDWRWGGGVMIGHHNQYGQYYIMSFKVKLICHNCGKITTEKSKLFSKTDIASNYYFLERKHYWHTLDDCIKELKTTENANLVKKSFTTKLNKKYNLNLTINDL